MFDYNTHKRLVLLYKLGIPVPEPYGAVYSIVFGFFETTRAVKLKSANDIENTCYLRYYQEEDIEKIIFVTYKSMPYNINIILESNIDYFGIMEMIYDFTTIKKHELKEITIVVLRHLGVKFDLFGISPDSDFLAGSHFGYLRIQLELHKHFEENLNI